MTAPGFANPRTWTWLAIALIAAGLVWLLSPILAPFLAGAIVAYVLNPLVNRISGRYAGRTLAVLIVLVLVIVVFVALMLVGLPLFYKAARMMPDPPPTFLPCLPTHVSPL